MSGDVRAAPARARASRLPRRAQFLPPGVALPELRTARAIRDHTTHSIAKMPAQENTCAAMLAAARLYDRLQSLGYWEQLHCPQPLGFRPSFHPVQEVGSACEAWVQRGAQFVLSRVLSGNMHGLEWSAGSSTRFYLLWLASLHSVEHDAGWAAIVERQIRTELPHAATAAWRFDRVAANASFRGERKAFQAYVNVPLQRAKYDFVSVDGRARGRCLDRVRVDRLVGRGGMTTAVVALRARAALAAETDSHRGAADAQRNPADQTRKSKPPFCS